MNEERETKSVSVYASLIKSVSRIFSYDSKEQILFAKRLSLYLRSGIPILEALTLMSEDAPHTKARRVVEHLANTVAEGKLLSYGLSRSHPPFEKVCVGLIRVGEASGVLSESLAYAATALEKRRDLSQKLLGALLYPGIITVGTLLIAWFLLVYTFPKLLPILKGMHMQLPLVTHLVLTVSEFITRNGIFLLFSLFTLMVLFVVIYTTLLSVRQGIDRALLHLPIFGPLLKTYYLATIARTLAILLGSGTRLAFALRLTSETIANKTYQSALMHASDRILMGERFSYSLREKRFLFSSPFIHLVGAGEATGFLPETFATLASTYEEEFESRTKMLTTLIEPVLMLILGLMVGTIALAIISPLYSLTGGFS